MLRGIHTYQVGRNKGKLRIWLESLSLSDAKFTPGTPVSVEYGNEIVIRSTEEEQAQLHVSARKKNGREIPILDLTKDVDTVFTYKEKIRVEVSEGEIRITKTRSFQIIENVEPSTIPLEKFKIVSLPCGAGFGSHAFTSTGLFELCAAGDLDDLALETLRYNDRDPILYHGNMYDIHQDDVPSAQVFLYTPDCTSYSNLGRKDYVCSPSAPMNHQALRLISAKKFPVVLVENVTEYGKSIWYQHFKRIMNGLGYNVFDRVLNAWDFGTIATRPRFISCFVLKPYRFEFPEPKLNAAHRDKVKRFVNEIENRNWLSISESKTLQFFFGKHKSEQNAKGNGFAINDGCIVGLESKKMRALTASYHKISPIGPFLVHPKDPDKLSLFTPEEALKIQGFSEFEFPEWLSNTQRYIQIGQAVCARMFRALAVSIATTLMEMQLGAKKRIRNTVEFVQSYTETFPLESNDQGQLAFAL